MSKTTHTMVEEEDVITIYRPNGQVLYLINGNDTTFAAELLRNLNRAPTSDPSTLASGART